MNKFVNYDELAPGLKQQYKLIVREAFPKIIHESDVVKEYWTKVENSFPEFQRFLIDEEENIIGFICTVPFFGINP